MNWRTAGVLLVHPERLEPVYYGRLLHKNAFRWCSVQIHNGLAVEGGVSEAFANGWVERVRAQGIQVGGWGVNLDQPEREAAVADSWIRRYRLAHYIADAEGPHKADWPGGDPGRSARFVAKFRELQPHLPAALTTFGAAEGDNSLGSCSDDRGPFMYRPWLRAGFRLLPQAYLPTGESQAPSICYRQAAASGWPRSYVHVMVGNYDGRGPDDYIGQLRKIARVSNGAARGFSVFAAETMREEDYEAYGRAIRRGILPHGWLADT